MTQAVPLPPLRATDKLDRSNAQGALLSDQRTVLEGVEMTADEVKRADQPGRFDQATERYPRRLIRAGLPYLQPVSTSARTRVMVLLKRLVIVMCT